MNAHGHVTPRADGIKVRCGGPAICGVCAREYARVHGKMTDIPDVPASEIVRLANQSGTISRLTADLAERTRERDDKDSAINTILDSLTRARAANAALQARVDARDEALRKEMELFVNDDRVLYPDNEVLAAFDRILAVLSPAGAVETPPSFGDPAPKNFTGERILTEDEKWQMSPETRAKIEEIERFRRESAVRFRDAMFGNGDGSRTGLPPPSGSDRSTGEKEGRP